MGVSLGVAALIVVLSVMNGFYVFVRDMLVSVNPHLTIESVESAGLTDADSIIASASKISGVSGAFAFVEGKALVLHDGSGSTNIIVRARGIDLRTRKGSGVEEHVFMGTTDLDRVDGKPGMLISSGLANRLDLSPASGSLRASRVSLLSPSGLERSVTRVIGAPPLKTFEIRGVYELQSAFDESYVFIDFREAQTLFGLGQSVSAIEIRLEDYKMADKIKPALEKVVGSTAKVETWYESQQALYDVMRLEKRGAAFILYLIVIVAAFTVVGSLTMIVVEKRKDIAVLKSLGMTDVRVRQLFLLEGFLVGIIGTTVGLLVGLGISVAQDKLELVPMAERGSFLLDAYPVAIQFGDVATIAIAAIVLCVAASVYPARRASRITPAAALAER